MVVVEPFSAACFFAVKCREDEIKQTRMKRKREREIKIYRGINKERGKETLPCARPVKFRGHILPTHERNEHP